MCRMLVHGKATLKQKSIECFYFLKLNKKKCGGRRVNGSSLVVGGS